MSTPPIPEVTRALLHLEYADGTVREIEAERPYRAEIELTMPGPRPVPLQGAASPAIITPALDPASVSLTFQADPRYPLAVRAFSTVDGAEDALPLLQPRATGG